MAIDVTDEIWVTAMLAYDAASGGHGERLNAALTAALDHVKQTPDPWLPISTAPKSDATI